MHVLIISFIFTLLQETEASQKCLTDHDFNRNKCGDYFMNYNNCMKFWVSITISQPDK